MKFPKIIPNDDKAEQINKIASQHNPDMIKKWIHHSITVADIHLRTSLPYIAFLYKFNNMDNHYNDFIELMDKHYGENGNDIILDYAILNEMDLNYVDTLWQNKSVTLSRPTIEVTKNVDEKYIRFFIENDKFVSQLKKLIESKVFIDTLKSSPRFITIGHQYPKFSKLLVDAFNISNDTAFLPNEAQDIFLF